MRKAMATQSFILGVLLLAPVGTAWATDIWDQASTNDDSSTNTRNVLLPGDSQRHDVQAKAGPTADQDWYRLVVTGGHSYEVRVGGRQDTCFDFVGNNFEVLQSNASTLITTGVDVVGSNAISSYRATFVAPTDDNVFVHLTGATSCTVTSEYTIQVFDTTLASPRWSTFGGFHSEFGFRNTTSTPINGTLTLFNADGTVNATSTFTIPVNGTTFRDTRASALIGPTGMTIPDDNAGSAQFTHSGVAGGVIADSFIVHPGFPTGPFVVLVAFDPAGQTPH